DRRDMRTGQQRSIRPEARAGEPHYRFQWNSPVVISAHDHTTVYYGGNYLFKSANRGDTWTRLGGDLTTGVDRNKLPILGKVPDKTTLSRHDGVQEYPTITTLSESPLTPNVLWVGTDDGNLQVTRDGGKTWKNVVTKVSGVPKGTYVSRVVASKTGEGAAFATFDAHRSDDYNVYVLATHGRSIWIFDDLTPVEKMDANVPNAPLTFFPPRTAMTWFIRQRRWSAGQQMFAAKNPPYGALLSYFLKEAVPPEPPKTNK